MRPQSVVAALFIASIILCTSVCAQKVTIDPNTAPSQAVSKPQVSPLDSDARLGQKITYRAKHVPVKTILADISEVTGVALFSGSSAQDWQVRDRRMCVFVKDVALRDLMRSIA